MKSIATTLPIKDTNAFSKLVVDYLATAESLQPFYAFTPKMESFDLAIANRKQFGVNRKVLVDALQKQYESVTTTPQVEANINALSSADTFTITTAHQNNIFAGPLYFIYKILHTVKLAAALKEKYPTLNFVPVFYIGSEDADLEELNHIQIGDKKYQWNTQQTGAVGRMVVDKSLVGLIQELEGHLGVLPFGKELTGIFRNCYQIGKSIQQATFELLHTLFGHLGLVVLIPDNALLKRQVISIFKDDLINHSAQGLVENTNENLAKAAYKVQAFPRPINLFYLIDDKRERIEREGEMWIVMNTTIQFTQEELLAELENHPERFSPNVILRGVFQESILPNVAFIGGGGELAYWLQLKSVFDHYNVYYPLMVLRNSFLLIEPKDKANIDKLQFSIPTIFRSVRELLNIIVERESDFDTDIATELRDLQIIYQSLLKKGIAIDTTLRAHIESLEKKSAKKIITLQSKMKRAERRKFAEAEKHILQMKKTLFPQGLQERYENFSSYYAKYGSEFFEVLLKHSPTISNEFVVIEL